MNRDSSLSSLPSSSSSNMVEFKTVGKFGTCVTVAC
jgi:hypothetical protein